MTTAKTDDLTLCVVITESYMDIFKHIFLPTLPNNFEEIIVLLIDEHHTKGAPPRSTALPGHVATAPFKRVNYLKLCFITDMVKLNLGKKLLFLDVDIICLRNDLKESISNLLETQDLLFQKQNDMDFNGQGNVGVFGINCNERTLDFFEQVVEPKSRSLLRHPGDSVRTELREVSPNEIDFIKVDKLLKERGSEEGIHNYSSLEEAIHEADPPTLGHIFPSGDQCVINNALTYGGKALNLIASTLSVEFFQGGLAEGGCTEPYELPSNCILFHAVGLSAPNRPPNWLEGASGKVGALSEAWYNHMRKKYGHSLSFLHHFGGLQRMGTVRTHVSVAENLVYDTIEGYQKIQRPVLLESMSDIKYVDHGFRTNAVLTIERALSEQARALLELAGADGPSVSYDDTSE